MSVEPNASAFAIDEPAPDLALVWRGACIDIFARAEHAVANCLDDVAGHDWQLSRDASSAHHTARMKALVKAIAQNAPFGHGPHAIEILTRWIDLQRDRAWIAHARCSRRHGRLTFQHHTWDNDRRELKTICMTLAEALARVEQFAFELHRLRRALEQIGSQAKKASISAKTPPSS